MKQIVIARELRYAGKPYLQGETVDIEDRHVKILKATKKVGDPPKRVAPVRRVASTRAPQAETAPPTEPTYRTRRLSAED